MHPTTTTNPTEGRQGGEERIPEAQEAMTMSAMNWLAAQLTWERRLAELREERTQSGAEIRRSADDETRTEREAA